MSLGKVSLTKIKKTDSESSNKSKEISGGLVIILLCIATIAGAFLTGLGSDISSDAILGAGLALTILGAVFCMAVSFHYFGW